MWTFAETETVSAFQKIVVGPAISSLHLLGAQTSAAST